MIEIPIDISLFLTILFLAAGILGCVVIFLGVMLIRMKVYSGIIVILLGIAVIITTLHGFGIEIFKVVPY